MARVRTWAKEDYEYYGALPLHLAKPRRKELNWMSLRKSDLPGIVRTPLHELCSRLAHEEQFPKTFVMHQSVQTEMSETYSIPPQTGLHSVEIPAHFLLTSSS